MSKNIVVVHAKCTHCNKDVVGPEDSFDEVWNAHRDNCDKFKSFMEIIKDLHEKDLLQTVVELGRVEQIEKSLKRLIKKYKASPEELIEILEMFGVEDKGRLNDA